MKKAKIILLTSCLFFLFGSQISQAQVSTIVSLGSDGKLVYVADSKGNKVPDFSGVGYKNSEAPIPDVPVVLTIEAVDGDNLSNVQTAINQVAAMTPNANGIRGAILFKRGIYNISDTIKITAGGIVLRGEGADSLGTRFVATKTATHTFIFFNGPQNYSRISSSKKAIMDTYVPYGANQFTVATGHTFQVGNSVVVHRVPKQSWINMLHMDSLSFINPGMTGINNWVPSAYDVYFQRKITAVNGNLITIDAPMVDIIDSTYATGDVSRYTENRIQNCGIENLRLLSNYASATDNNHGWDAIEFGNAINCWARNLEAYYFGHSCVSISDAASWVTVQDCKMIDAKSTLDGGERYSFNIDGQRSLVKNCFTRNGRHDFVSGSRTAGPNVFYNSTATLQQADIGPHQRWTTGILFDNIIGNGAYAVQNRTNSGSGHGWAGAETMFWNCQGDRLVLQDPEGDNTNWAIGYKSWITNIGDLGTWPLGYVESRGTHITAIPSLFMAQLNERLNSILPVTISKFDVIKKGTSVEIDWTTSRELNNKKFIIEHATDGSNFQVIGELVARGANSISTLYTFLHSTPSIGLNYYRLKQMDVDGKISFSPTRAILFNNNSLVLKSNIVYDRLELYCNQATPLSINIYNASGQQCMQSKIEGYQTIALGNLAAGMYVIKASNGETLRFVKK